MIQVNRFAIKMRGEPYDSLSHRSRLIVDGQLTSFSVPGHTLLHQFETSSCYLLVTDYDCPFEESVCFVAISKDIRRTLDSRCVGAPYASYLLKDIHWTDERHFYATFVDRTDRWSFSIREHEIPMLRRKLKMIRLSGQDI